MHIRLYFFFFFYFPYQYSCLENKSLFVKILQKIERKKKMIHLNFLTMTSFNTKYM